MSQDLLSYQTEFSGNIVQLGRYLRGQGFELGTREEMDALQALALLPLESSELYQNILRAVFAKTPQQFETFKDLYLEYVEQQKKAVNSKVKSVEGRKSKRKDKTPSFEALKDWLYGRPSDEEAAIASYSGLEVLTKKDFVSMSEDELRLITQVLEKISRKIAHRKSRLRSRTKKRQQVDLRMTIRQALANKRGQELVYSKRKNQKLNLVLLCDVSKSMDLYSRFFIQMIYAFHKGYDKIETFVFSTALHRVTDILDNHQSDEALSIISERVPEWSGGTKIGQCFQHFVDDFGHSLLHRKSIVIILSDGWDADAAELIDQSMKSIHKSARKVIWLNPLAGHPAFEPATIGLEVALPHVDSFLPAHNLESLRQVIKSL